MAMITCSAGHEPIAYNQTTLVGRTTCPLCIAKGADGSDECARQLRESERLMAKEAAILNLQQQLAYERSRNAQQCKWLQSLAEKLGVPVGSDLRDGVDAAVTQLQARYETYKQAYAERLKECDDLRRRLTELRTDHSAVCAKLAAERAEGQRWSGLGVAINPEAEASAARERERCISAVAASRRIYTTATGTERQRELEEARVTMVAYLKLKADEEDWHGVQDAGSDLRDIDAELLGLARQ